MSGAGGFFFSSIGKKIVMAVTGAVFVAYVLGHMSGNLLVFLGPEAMNEYGEWLRELGHGSLLWVARGVLLLALALHVWASISLALENRAARPVGYRKSSPDASTYASRTMIWSGPILGLFVLYHLLHLTFGTAHADFVHGDVYRNVVVGFSNWLVTGVYVVAMLALGLHLHHGAWSMFQSVGASHPRYDRWRRVFATLFTLVVTIGFLSVPLAVVTGLVR